MNLSDRLRGVAVAILLMLICVPMAIAVTILTSSFWLFCEQTFNIEAYGHSGPADWCYLATYCFMLAIIAVIRVLSPKKRSKGKNVS